MKFDHLFAKQILERGRRYYLEGRVEHVYMKNDTITGEVDGSEVYHCEITLDGKGNVKDMSCDCPYGEDGTPCKHEAALLYAYTRDGVDEGEDSFEEITQLVADADQDAKDDFLIQLFQNDPGQLQAFKKSARIAYDDQDLKNMIANMRSIVDTNMMDGFIDYRDMFDFDQEMEDVFYDIDELIDDERRSYAYEMILETFDALLDVECDDSDGYYGQMFKRLGDDLGILLSDATHEELDQYYNQIMDLVYDQRIDFQEENLLEALTYITDDDYVQKLNDDLDDLMENASQYSTDYAAYVLMSDIHNNAPIEKVLYQYHHLRYKGDMTDLVLDYLEEIGDDEDYEKELKASIEEANNWEVVEYVERLKDFYKELGREKDYLKLLEKLLTTYSPGTYQYYEEYKEALGEKWEENKMYILSRIPANSDKNKILYQEGLYDQLMHSIEQSGSLEEAKEYLSFLNNDYAKQLLAVFTKGIRKKAARTSNRYVYREIAGDLIVMLEINGAKDEVISLLDEFRTNYRNRWAMMQELNSVDQYL